MARHVRNDLLRPGLLIAALLLAELLDELIYSTSEAAWPLIRSDLGLTYVQIGLLISIPKVLGGIIEPVLGILADAGKRRIIMLAGGVCYMLGLALVAASTGFWMLMVALVIISPASGGFVGLSQASLMDHEPDRHEQNMARWTFTGSLGVVIGPLALSVITVLGPGWRWLFTGLAALGLMLVALMWRLPLPGGQPEQLLSRADQRSDWWGFKSGLADALKALRRGSVLRWLVLLEFSDLMLDVLYSLLALYLVDVGGLTAQTAALAVTVWTGVGLLGDLLLIPLLERVRGLSYLRVSAMIELILYPAFLLVDHLWVRLIILGLLGLFNSGWYAILQGQLYSAMPGQSGTAALTVSNITGLAGGLIPAGLGLIAQSFGLPAAMWCLLMGPVALLIGLPRRGAITTLSAEEETL